MSAHYAVMGNPIEHSRSPAIHRMFAQQTGQDISYDIQSVAIDGFDEAAVRFFGEGGSGLNITMPFKGDACAWAAQLSEDAQCARAVNTLFKNADGVICGTTTDGVGLLADLQQNLAWQLSGAKVLVIGAGGATRGVLRPLLAASPAELMLHNRTIDKAQQLQSDFAGYGHVGVYSGEDEGRAFDIVINATSTSMHKQLPAIAASIFAGGAKAYDMFYSTETTSFMSWALANGASEASDGLGMLVEQAAASFEIWRGVQPSTADVIAQIRKTMLAEL